MPSQPETLRFNPNNATTGIVERVRTADGGTRVRKQLRRAGTVPDAPSHWRSSVNPSDWNYWAREAEVYADPSLRDSLAGTGLDLPAAQVGAEVRERPATIDLLLEDVRGTAGSEFSLADHVATAAALGRWQARPPRPTPAWASRGFLRAYSTSRPGDLGLIEDDAAWAHPLIRDTWPADLRSGWRRLLAHQDDLLTVLERLPRTLCHLDAWVANVIRRPTGEVVLLDWAFAGDGAIGEDLGNYLPDAVFDLFWPAERLAELEAVCWPAYLGGLRSRGWDGRGDQARLGLVASCVKYVWLLPLLLEGAGDAEHVAYHRSADASHLYRQRGTALAHLVTWCDEALELLG